MRTRVKRGLEELRARLEREPRKGNGLWCLALVHGLKIAPPSLIGAAFTLAGAGLAGVLAVSTAKKVLAATLVIALATSAFLFARRLEPLHPPGEAQAALPGPDTTKLSTGELPAAVGETESRSALATETPAPPAAPATTGSVRLVLHWHDGTPAADVTAVIYCGGSEDFYGDARAVRTGADGTHLCEALPPGHVMAYLDRGPVGECKLAAGEAAEIALTIPRGFDLAGEVVERDGRPVAGAEILIDRMGNGWNANSVTHTDSEGRFRLRSLQSSLWWITARAALHAPSPQVQLLGGAVDVDDLRIVLDGRGACVEGDVLDARGQPLANAQVLLGDEQAFEQLQLEGGRQARVPAAQLAHTDETGRFRFAGAPLGHLAVQARARGQAPWKGEVETVEGARAALSIRMQAGVSLRGRAADAQGAPLKAELHGNGDYGFAARTKRCAQDGTFVVIDLPCGEFEVSASADGHEDARTKLMGTPGAQLVWNPVLGSGLKISGRLVAPGTDFSKWWMYCESEDWQNAPYRASVSPKADGSFEFAGCANALHKIRAQGPGASLFPVANFEARPSTEPVLVPIDAAMLPTCKLRGRILDDQGRPLAGVAFSVGLTGVNFAPLETTDAEGRFLLGPTPPGEYGIQVRLPGFCTRNSDRAKLEANTEWDFGDLQLTRGGTIAVHLARPSPTPVAVEIRRGDVPAGWFGLQEELGRSDPLEPGEYELRAWIDGKAVENPAGALRATVRAGEETAVELSLP